MLIVDRALMREILATSLAVMLVFVLLFVTVSLVNILAKAAVGAIPVGIVFVLLGLQTVKVFSLILPLALFVGILLTLGRWYRDNEMTVLAACGIGLVRFMRPVLLLAAGFATVAALFAFYLAPLSVSLIAQARSDSAGRHEVQEVAPGVFNENRDGGGFFYVEQVNRNDATLTNVFMSKEDAGKYGVLVARNGHQYVDEKTGDKFLVFKNGTRYEGTPGSSDYRILNFESYAVRIEPRAPAVPITGHDAIPMWRLFGTSDRNAQAEWQWRLAKPISLVLLALLAMVFAYTDARRGRYTGLFIAILVYFLYSNFLGMGNILLKQGRVPPVVGLWWVHLLFLALAAYLLHRRANNQPLLPALMRRRRTKT
jgi:lipopolysaccharide export system permease protein